jgi:20S proteasome alpha/beta subunit
VTIFKESEINMFHATTIIGVRHKGQVAIAGDGQVTAGNSVIMKNKIRFWLDLPAQWQMLFH